jgi:hypothetical protein
MLIGEQIQDDIVWYSVCLGFATKELQMKLAKIILLLMLASLTAVSAKAGDITVLDPSSGQNQNFWPGFGTKYSGTFQGLTENKSDHWGTPDITKALVSFNGNKLIKISIDFSFPDKDLWTSIKPGDLFLSLNSKTNPVWDIVLDSPWVSKTSSTPVLSGNWNAYNVSSEKLSFSDPTVYEYSHFSSLDSSDPVVAAYLNKGWTLSQIAQLQDYNNGGTNAGIPRYDHPVAAREALLTNPSASLSGTSAFSGWKNDITNLSTMTISWDLSALNLSASDLTFAFAVSCANDNMFADTGPIPNPEPGTMLLMGAGALGAAFMRKRAKKATK